MKCFRIILWVFLVLYPILGTFLGIDMGDTGYHYYAYERLYTQSNYLSFTSYFSNVVGHIWISIFGFIGLWGLNLFEAVLEILIAIFVYRVISPRLGKTQTLIGLVVAICAFDTYLNVFNYHQFNVFLILIIMLSEYKAITEDKCIYSFIAGFSLAIIFFSRTGSITLITTVLLYIMWAIYVDVNKGFLRTHLIVFFSAMIDGAALIIILLASTDQWDLFVNNVFRLKELAHTTGSSYNINNLLNAFFLGNLKALAQGLMFISSFFFFLISFGLILKKEKHIKYAINICIAMAGVLIGYYLIKYSYDMNPVPQWPQMTTGPSFTIGVLYVMALVCFVSNMFSERGSKEIALLSAIAVLLPFYTIAGSSTGTKHAVLAFWVIAPIAIYSISKLILDKKDNSICMTLLRKLSLSTKHVTVFLSVAICIVGFMYKYGDLCYRTFNFDSIDRTELIYSINSPKLRFLKTTKREADAVNGVLREIEQVDENYPLIVFGGSLLFYSLTERDSFVQPWFSNSTYPNETLIDDLELSIRCKENLPIVIYGRTNNYYGYSKENYNVLLKSNKNNTFDGKKEILLRFLKDYNYKMQYINDYYIVLFPQGIAPQENCSFDDYVSYFK